MVPRALTIAGSDSGGGAGIQADLKAFAAAGCFGTSAIVALTAQNTVGVLAVHQLPREFVRAQLEAVFGDIGVDAAKTGMLFSAPVIETVADMLGEHPVPLVVDPVMVASSGARLLQEDAVEALVSRLFPLATVVTPNEVEAEASSATERSGSWRSGWSSSARRPRSSPAVTASRLTTSSTASDTSRSRSSVTASGLRTGPGARTRPRSRRCWRGACLSRRRRGERQRRPRAPCAGASRGRRRRRAGGRARAAGRGVSAGSDLALIRERKPLVHQITNYVVMNETANATLALGALPVMAHALQEVEEMASVASALVLNIGTLSDDWVESMLVAGRAANRAGVPVVLDPVGAGATTYRTETSRRLLAELADRGGARKLGRDRDPRGRAARDPRRRGVGEAAGPELAREAARALGTVVAITGPVDHVSDGETVHAVANGHELLGTVTGTGCMSTAITGCFLGVRGDDPLAAATEALVAFGVAGEDAAKKAKGPGSFHVALYDALYDLDPKKLDSRAR